LRGWFKPIPAKNLKIKSRPGAAFSIPVMRKLRLLLIQAAIALALQGATVAQAQFNHLGFTQLPQLDGGQTALFYPTLADENPVRQGPFELSWAADASPSLNNGRLIVISHGSGGSPWVHMDLTRELVRRGFIVALPQHQGDNYQDASRPGPESWARRPREIRRAIDAVAAYAPLADTLQLNKVGIFGGSAGGHDALVLAGGEWSPARFRNHCEKHLAEDFSSCVGFTTLLRGNWLDGPKLWLVRRIIAWRFSDETPQRYTDARIQAAIAMVPFAADFSPASLASPHIPLGLILAGKDVNQIPRFHGEAVAQACEPRCEILMRLPDAGHGAMLSPVPPLQAHSVAHTLLSDPPGFDRATSMPAINHAIAEFFAQHLLFEPGFQTR
jgi:predicted dienelactone hydrolase